MAWRDSVYLFGGVGANGTESILDVTDELWRFDTRGLSWERVPRSEPWPSARRCTGVTLQGEAISLFGGSGVRLAESGALRYTFLNDRWTYDPNRGVWTCEAPSEDHGAVPAADRPETAGPVPRYTPVYTWFEGARVVFGGYTEDRAGKRKLNDLWVCRNGAWQSIRSPGAEGYQQGASWPGVRYGCMSAAGDRTLYVCGGFSDEGDHIDLWQFELDRAEWHLLAPDEQSPGRPSPRYCAAAALWKGSFWLFGGRSRSNPKLNFNDLWRFDLSEGRWHLVHGNRAPHYYDTRAGFPAYHAKTSSAVVHGHWYLWGGEGAHGHVSDFWRFDLERQSWQLVQVARPDDPLFW